MQVFEFVRRAVAERAVAAGVWLADVDGCLACLANDVVLATPMGPSIQESTAGGKMRT